MPSAPPDTDDPIDFRVHVVAESIRLFAEQGYESTTVEQIAAAAGISRRTFFRQFGAKEDVIFADHESLLELVAAHLSDGPEADPYESVCTAAELVFLHFRDSRMMAVRRLRIVQGVPALRDRELVTTYRYQRLFEDHLRARLPEESPAQLIGYAAAITSAHNYLLRAMIRGDENATLEHLRDELRQLRRTFTRREVDAGADAVSVITHPAGMSPEEIGHRVVEQLRAQRRDRGQ
ncbi:TetR family transcriptional regulator [Gordonia sp. Z-3]|jgi:AcrR family transcriptional regulator|uniref:TetR family transcriptional regulator n=2 Tax=Gordonia TaxID=2053 RepID=A0A9X3D1C6_9ACTN|nr:MULTISPECIES: TetR family transcriptional regulator [Gordonia]MAU84486.1 TetR family transcriptional regulator [Gordonia sp. (in: high G+C Gram-positive bacteria)]MCF3939366.1 TetR family transcriptional regulator [Gordonia tangerina]MCX2963036.1 TetR family transcriptional regulator [Gordonia aquimaris]MED5802082.1 TetR family transcriptional regulator [Gordonia sp. Z-3]